MADAPRDENRETVLLGVSTLDATKTVPVAVNPSTNAIIVQII